MQNGGIELLDGGARMRVTYKLRPGVKWHDGKPFTSADVKFTWEAVKDPKFIAESKDGTGDVASIDTPDELTAIVNYKTVSPTFASTLFTFGILPKHALEGKDLNKDPYNDKPLGTGPFVVSEFKHGQHVIVERNPNYWRKDDGGQALPYIDRIVFKIIPDSNTLMTQLKSGEVGFVYRVPYSQAKQLESVGSLELMKGPLLSWQHLDFNFKGPKALQDLAVSDVALANKLLDEAGYAKAADGIRAKGGERMSYRIVATAGLADDEIAEQVIIAQLKAIGIEVTPDNKSGVAFREARYKGNYDLLYARWITSADPVYSVFFGSKGANNGQGYSNAKLDEVLRRMETTLDPELRKSTAKEMQAILAEDLPTIPLTTNVGVIAKTKKLKNFVPNPTNMTNFVDTSRWYLE